MRMTAAVVAIAFAGACAVPAFAAPVTLKGEIVDQACYVKDKANNAGKDHKMPKDTADCAIGCAKKGAPLALLTSDGKVYTITGDMVANNNAKLIAHVSHTVAITGDVTEKDGKMSIAGATVKMVK